MSSKHNSNSNTFFFIVFISFIALMAFMMKPIFNSILFGAIIAGFFYPLFSRIEKFPKISRNIAAILTTVLVIFVVFIPSVFIILALSKESIVLYNNAREFFMSEQFRDLFKPENETYQMVTAFLAELGIEADITKLRTGIIAYLQQFSGFIIETVNSVISNILSFLFQFVIMLLVIYSLFSQGEKLKKFLMKLSPLTDEEEELLLDNFNQMNYVTIVCNGIGGIMQGVLAGIGFWLAGVPSAILWTVVMAVLAFIPLVGISLVTIPTAIIIAVSGNIVTAVILLVYCFAVSLTVENVFKPRFIGQRVRINPLFILFCIIGGITFFGVPGIFYGPIIGIVFLTLVQLYHEHYKNS